MEQAQAFLEKVKNDEELQRKLNEAQDNETKLEIARQEGFEFDLEEAKKAKEELSDEQLAEAAGGEMSKLAQIKACVRRGDDSDIPTTLYEIKQ